MANRKQTPSLIVLHPAAPDTPESLTGKFKPSDEQKRFRETVAQCVTEETILSFDGWRAQHRVRCGESIGRRQWDRWNDNPAFRDWFMDVMPTPPSAMEIQIAQAVAKRKLIERVGNDDASVARTAMTDLAKFAPEAPAAPAPGVAKPSMAGVLARVRGK